MPAPPEDPRLRAGVYLIFTLSGACGLIWEVLWVRQLTLVFGVSTYAVCTVLGAFMAGLGLGSYLWGRWAARSRRVLALYGWLELGIGVLGLLLPFQLQALMHAYARGYESLMDRPGWLVLVRVVAVSVVLLLPCTLMGGTISVLSRFFARRRESLGRDLGLLYALNTLGAVFGCLLAGFALIPALGLRATGWSAAGGNFLVAALAIFLGRREVTVVEPRAAGAARRSGSARLALLVFALSGFCALGYQVLWTRALVFYLHNSTYAFTAMLAVFLTGLSLGSLLLNRRLDHSARPSLYLFLSQAGIPATTILGLTLFALLPLLLARLLPPLSIDSWGKALALQFSQALGILLPITFFMGLAFPAATRMAVQSLEGVSRAVGELYAFNTLGCIAGSLVVGFGLLPVLGLMGSFQVLMTVNLVLALVALWPGKEIGRSGKIAGTLLIAGLWVAKERVLPEEFFRRAFGQGAPVLLYRDGATDTVMVKAVPGQEELRFLCFADGRGTAGTNTSPQNRFMAHLPLLLHPAPREVLTICFGVGNTLSAIAANPQVERVECVELSPSVVDAAPYFPTNEDVLHHPKVSIRFQDGRNHLLGTTRRYDVIQLEPPEIHTDGVVNLYTREFYRLCRRRLREDGILCQWINVQMIPLEEQRRLIATFQETFPHTTAWMLTRTLTHVLLIGTPQELRISYARLRERFADPVLGPDLRDKTFLDSPEAFLANFKLSEDGVRAFVAGAAPITDDRTVVDFSAPRSVDANYGLSNAFSGVKIAGILEAGVPATVRYYADKQRAMLDAVEDVMPLLTDFASEEGRAACRARLEEEHRRWRERTLEEIAEQERSGVVRVNT